MTEHAIMLIGGPDSGKTNYLARLWAALRSRKGKLVAPEIPAEIQYVEEALAHLLKGQFAPRSEPTLEQGESFSVPVVSATDPATRFDIVVPDVLGELWKRAVESSELPEQWMKVLEDATGALLFVRIQSDQNVGPLDWVTSAELLRMTPPSVEENTERKVPTQVALCELLRFMENRLGVSRPGIRPRVAVLVTAWDRLDVVTQHAGPSAFLKSEYPIFAGRLSDVSRFDLRVFGVSVVGGDFVEEEFATRFYDANLDDSGYIVLEDNGSVQEKLDLTLPVAWVVNG